MSRRRRWMLCWLGALALSVLTFTPLVTPAGVFRPTLAGIPLTLWTGIIIAFAYILLTHFAGKLHPEIETEDQEVDQ